MKRYWVFAGEYFYPDPGMWDFVASYDDPEAARSRAKQSVSGLRPLSWAQVVDSITGEVEDFAEHGAGVTHIWFAKDAP